MIKQAAIVAGGEGLRMRAVSALPKPLLPVGDRPLVERQLDWLTAAGFSDVFLCLGYRPDEFRERLGDGSRWGLKLHYRVEASPRGTAGAVADLKPSEDLLVVYGDLFVELDCARLLAFHEERGAAATLVARKTDHPYDSDLVAADGERALRVYRAQPGEPVDALALAAVWVVSPRLLALAPRDRPSDFGREVFPRALAAGLPLAVYRTDERVLDLGTPERREAFLRAWRG